MKEVPPTVVIDLVGLVSSEKSILPMSGRSQLASALLTGLTDCPGIVGMVTKTVSRRRGPWRAWVVALRKACADNPAIAIAHGLEDLCELKVPVKKAKRGKKKAVAELDLEGGSQ
jgi:hypothetical protein